MINIELRTKDGKSRLKEMRFTPEIQIDVCINNYLKKLEKEEVLDFHIQNIANHIYYNGKKIDRRKFFKDYGFKNRDKLILSEKEIIFQNPTVYRKLFQFLAVTEREPISISVEPPQPPVKKKSLSYLLIILSFLLLGLLIFLVLWFYFKESNKPKIDPPEKYIVDLEYRVNETMFFINKRINNSTLVYNGQMENQITETFTNFSVTIADEKEVDNKKLYSAYFVVINMTTSNKTNTNLEASFDLFESLQSNDDKRNLEEGEQVIDLSNKNLNDINISEYIDTSDFSTDEINDLMDSFKSLPIIRFEFFRNGSIKEIFLPKSLKSNIFYNIYDLIDKVIPKINKELYNCGDIDSYWNETNQDSDDSDDSDELEELEDEEWEEENEEQSTMFIRRNSENEQKEQKEPYRGINSTDDNSVNLIEVDKSTVKSGNDMQCEGSQVNSNIERKYNNELKKIEDINYSGEASLVNQLPPDEEEYNEITEQRIQSNILDNDLKEMLFNTETSIKFIKNITERKVISVLDDVWSRIETIRYNESEYSNTSLRLLNSLPMNDVKVVNSRENSIWKKVAHFYKTKKIAKRKIEQIRKLSPALFQYPLSYAYNIFKTNIFGLKLQFQVVESIEHTEGLIELQFILTIGCLDFMFPFKVYDTGIGKIIKSSQLMTQQLMDLLKDSGKNIAKYNKAFSPYIIESEQSLKELIQSPYDFSDLYRKPYNDLYESIKNFTTDTFIELINTIVKSHDNYTALLNRVKKGEEVSINEIINEIQEQYFSFIEEMTNNLEQFYNQSIKYLEDIQGLITENFQIDILYDIKDNVIKAKKVFTKFVDLLFKAIEKGMSKFQYNLQEYIQNLIGDLLYNSQFIAESLNENEILRNAISERDRNSIIIKLKDFTRIVNEITNYLYGRINDDYEANFSNDNPNSVKISVINKVNNLSEKFEKESNDLINKIKKLIKYIEHYDLYISHLDKIDDINNNIQNNMYEDINNNILDLINKNIDIKFDTYSLNKITQQISEYLKEDIYNINQYISQYTEQYKKENKYKMLSNMTKIHKYFLCDEMKKLMKDFHNLIIKAVNEKIKDTIYDNYDKGIAYVKAVYQRLYEKRHKDAKGVGNRFLKIIPKFVTNNANLLSTILTEFPNLAKKHFVKIKEDIFSYFENKLKQINKYHLNDEIYKDFIDLYTKEINDIKDNILFYFNEDVFLDELSLNISNYTSEKAIQMDSEKNKIYSYYYDLIMRIQDFPIGHNDDYYWRWVVKVGFATIRRTFHRHVSEYKKLLNLTKNMDSIDKYLEQKRLILVKQFTSNFEDNINNYVSLGKIPYINLNDYIEEKLQNNSILENLLYNYKNIINNDKKNNLLFFSNNMDKIHDKLNTYFKNIESNIMQINIDYLNNYYYRDYESFLEYPNEINLRLSYIKNEFSNFSNKIQNEINYYYQQKITNHIELIKNYSIAYMKNNFNFIQNEVYPKKIFAEYFNTKLGIINSALEDINKEDELENKEESFDSLEYDSKNNLIIENISKSVDDFDLLIYENFTNYTYKITDYSKYNFDITKLRTAIYYSQNALKLFEMSEFKYKIEDKNLRNKLNSTTDFGVNELTNQSVEILQYMNQKSYDELNDYFKYYKQRLDPYIINDKDYTDNIEKLKPILNKTITIPDKYKEEYKKETEKLLATINETLLKEVKKVKSEGKYNYDLDNYKDYFNTILEEIKQYFKNLLDNSFKFGYNFVFTNSFLDEVDKLHSKKNDYFKKLIKSFEKFYNIKFFNFTFYVSDYTENYMKELHENHFNFTYDYVNVLEEFLDNKSHNEIINNLEELNKTTVNKLYLIFEGFMSKLNENISEYIQESYIEELYENRTKCANYTLDDLNETDPFFNETLSFVELCNSTNNFSQKEFYYKNFTNEEGLSEIKENIRQTLESYFNQISLSDILYKNTKELYNKELALNDYSTDITKEYFEYELSDFEISSEILSYFDQEEYKNFLNESLIQAFNNSVGEFMNSIILKEELFKIDIDISEKYDTKLNLFEIKLENELKYYIYLLKNSDEIGITTKKTFSNLYNNIIKEFNFIIEELNNDFYYGLDNFFMKNKAIFIDDYYKYLKNDKSNKIFKLKDYIDKMFSSFYFNHSLENVIKENIYNNFIGEVKNNINETIKNKIEDLNNKIDTLNTSLSEQLDNAKISEINPDMIPIINKNDEYNNLIDMQSNSVIFNVNNYPYELFLNFTKEKLEPSLLEIKKIYDKIQDELLAQIFKKVDEMPNYYLFIMEKLPTDNMTEIILNITEENNILFNSYYYKVTNDSINYRKKFLDFRRLNLIKQNIYNNKKLHSNNNRARFIKNNNIQNKTNKTNDNKHYDNNSVNQNRRNLQHMTSGYLSFTDVEKILLANNYSIGNFSILYLDKDYRVLNTTLKSFNNKIETYLKKLENPLSIITLRMSTLLTEEKMEEFKKKIYREMNLIKEYSNMHAETISSKILNYMHLLSNESLVILNNAENLITNNVENLYDDLLTYILSRFKSKHFKWDQKDILANNEIDMSKETEEQLGLNITNKIPDIIKDIIPIDFDAEEYLDTKALDKFLDSIDEFINNDEAPIDIFIIFPIFFIPFIARFRLEYGFEIGINLYVEKHLLCTEIYGEAHSSASVSAGIFLGIVEFGGGLRGLLGYGRIGMIPKIDFKYLKAKIEYYVKLATLKFQVFAYLMMLFPEIIWIKIKFIFFTIRIPFIIFVLKRFEIGSQWTKGLQTYLSFEKDI